MRPTVCDIDLGAIGHNVRVLRDLAGGADLCAVVKADAYGHGAVPVARTVLAAGAERLAVAMVEEGAELRDAGLDGPIHVLSEPVPEAMAEVVERSLTPSVYTHDGIAALAEAAVGRRVPVEVLLDTGMRRVGAEPSDLADLVAAIDTAPALELSGVWTHFAVADEPGNAFTDRQIERFDDALAALGDRDLRSHLANSAGLLEHPATARAMVRSGIAVYGIDPAPDLAHAVDLRPALSLRSAVTFLKAVRAGEGVSYGHAWVAPVDTRIATVPIGYADGVRRDYGSRGGHVLIGGGRHPIVGRVTMDQLMVDVGDAPVSVGDAVVLIGRQGDQRISATDVARVLDTIAYEVVCAIGRRVPRVHHESR